MPEYLAPGVYVEEYDAPPKTIPGVSTSIDDATMRSLVESFEHVVAVAHPDWTGFNRSDPGVTLIEMFAWLAEGIAYRADGVSDARRDALLRALATLSTLPCAPSCRPLARPNFFSGRLLDAATLAAEQDYQREMRRLHNRALHGYGVASGLNVNIEAGGEPSVSVAPGYALDRCGNEIALCESAKLRLPAGQHEAFISLRYWEHACGHSPAPNGTMPAFIEDACIVAIAAHVPATAIALARVVHEADGWLLAASFVVPRALPSADQEEWGG